VLQHAIVAKQLFQNFFGELVVSFLIDGGSRFLPGFDFAVPGLDFAVKRENGRLPRA